MTSRRDPVARNRTDDLEAILDICSSMMVQRDLDVLLDLIINRTSEILDAERTSIFVVDHETKELWSRIAQDAEIREIRMPASRGIAGLAARSRRIINIRDAYRDKRFNPKIDRKTGYRTRTILCAPMVDHDDRVIGVLQVLNKKHGFFSPYDEKLIAAIAAQAAIAVENTQLYQERELTLKSILRAIGSLVDARDPVTAGHSDRVTRYCVALGRALKLPEDELRSLEYAAALHDIGKIGVRDHVLLKAAELTSEEYKLIQQHAVITRSTLEQIHFSTDLRHVPLIAGAHHEKLDGSGYPQKLKGAQISRAARILAIADVYDALTSYDRPYKRARTPEEAFAVLDQGRDRLFDGRIIDLFRRRKLYILEKRDYQRINAELAVEYAVMTRSTRDLLRGKGSRTVNVSASGLVFPSRESFTVGTYLDMILHLPDTNFSLVGRVMRCDKEPDQVSHSVAIRFLNMSWLVRERLSKYLVKMPEA